MTTLYLIRHAEAEGNVYRRCHGQYDALLTHRAPAQLEKLAERFRDVNLSAVYASDLYRARHTAKAVADVHGLTVKIRPALREIDMGEWEDLTWAYLPRAYPEMHHNWQKHPESCRVPGGETVTETGDRVFAALREIAAQHDGEEIAVVSHGTAIRGVLRLALGLEADQIGELGWGDNTCVAKFEYENGVCHPVYWNDASHLPEELSTFRQVGWTNVKGVPTTRQLWFKNYDPADENDRETFLRFERQVYTTAYGSTALLNEEAMLERAAACVALDPRAVTFGMLDDDPTALVFMNVLDETDPKAGLVGGFCIDEHWQGAGLSQQILGQAISVYRARGKEYLCAHVAAHNARAQGFYKKFAFENRGEIQNERGAHFAMYKRIKVDTCEEERGLFDLD